MPARKRHKPGGVEEGPDLTTKSGRRTAQQQAAKEFADRLAAEKAEQKRVQRERQEARRAAQRRQDLQAAKDAAAARLKEVRRRGLPGPVRAEAEEAYRAALDALLRDEQGLEPAPPPE